MATIIAKNNTSSAIFLDELGAEIPGSGQRDLTATFSLVQIFECESLVTHVTSGDIIINDGTSDLSISDGLDHVYVETKYEDFEEESTHDAEYIMGVPIESLPTDSTAELTFVYDPVINKVKVRAGSPVANEETPPDNPNQGDLWSPPDSAGLPYMWDSIFGYWVTIYRNIMTFGKGGNADGAYLSIGGWVGNDFYYAARDGIVYSIYTSSEGGALNKDFHLEENGTYIYDYAYDGVTLRHFVDNLGITITAESAIKLFCGYDGGQVVDTIVQVEIAWRYTGPGAP
ncbi:hypothetical protein KAR91_16115 [Candidatus Pacearchaeota archaeon]|nr:hypothetical protein [Candidatus Pacearchaeota archaeon]